MKLFHYCCSCSAGALGRRGMLRPSGHDNWGADFVWLTDLAVPDREALGLTSYLLKCDRLEYQYRVDTDVAEPWLETPERATLALDPYFHEFEDGRQPEHWFITRTAVLGIQNRAYVNPAPLPIRHLRWMGPTSL